MQPHDRHAVKNISYGDVRAQLFLWQKGLTLMPIWAVAVIPIVGFLCRGLGHAGVEIGYGLLLSLLAVYFLMDLLKRRIRLDDEYIFFGFMALPIKYILSVDVVYKRNKLLPTALAITSISGQRLKLSLNGLSNQNIEILVRHLQARNSNLQTAPVISTLIKCRRTTPKPLETPEKLELPYQAKQFIYESIDVFKLTAHTWMRVGPLLACVLVSPMWMSMISGLYVALQPHSFSQLQSLNLNTFLSHLSLGIATQIFGMVGVAALGVGKVAQNPVVTFAAGSFIAAVWAYVFSLIWKPNVLIADKKGMKLAIQSGAVCVPLALVSWSEIVGAGLSQREGQKPKILIKKRNGKTFELELSAIPVTDRGVLLKRIEKFVPTCQIEHELSQVMLPGSGQSYTELWLQSLNQPPDRKTLEPLEPGQTLGENRFEVLRSLGVGGQGTAYLCRPLDDPSGQTVVLKETIIPIFVDGLVRRKALESFESEARLLKTLNHDGVVGLSDYFVEDHRAYLVLEHIDGLSLRSLVLQDGALPEEQVLDLALQMCEILTFLHANGVVHRDFTPDNLILNSRGKLKLIDFNVAQQVQSGSTGTIVGKHAYLPPEQFRGKATSQSDLYAFGATIYFLLTGTDPEPISQSSPVKNNNEISAKLDQIVRRSTSLQLNKRYQAASEIALALLSSEVGESSAANDSSDRFEKSNSKLLNESNSAASQSEIQSTLPLHSESYVPNFDSNSNSNSEYEPDNSNEQDFVLSTKVRDKLEASENG